MLKRPDNRIILLSAIFLIGLAMITIPIIQQRKEIEDDNNLYAMIAEEIRHQQEAAGISPVQADDAETGEAEEPQAELPETDPETDPEEMDAEEDLALLPEQAEEPEKPDSAESAVSPSGFPSSSSAPASAPVRKSAGTSARSAASRNADYVAWISIPGTVINYPVVRSDNSEYYLHHLITGQESKLGTLFSLTTSDYELPSRNIAIYGHHLSNSTAMFSTLLDYKKESYWKNHQTIQVDSIYGSRTYRIFAVLNHTVSDWDASTASFADDRAFLKFVNRAKDKAFYDTGITVSEDDHIITLITCDRSYGGIQGRLLVMGVEQ